METVLHWCQLADCPVCHFLRYNYIDVSAIRCASLGLILLISSTMLSRLSGLLFSSRHNARLMSILLEECDDTSYLLKANTIRTVTSGTKSFRSLSRGNLLGHSCGWIQVTVDKHKNTTLYFAIGPIIIDSVDFWLTNTFCCISLWRDGNESQFCNTKQNAVICHVNHRKLCALYHPWEMWLNDGVANLLQSLHPLSDCDPNGVASGCSTDMGK